MCIAAIRILTPASLAQGSRAVCTVPFLQYGSAGGSVQRLNTAKGGYESAGQVRTLCVWPEKRVTCPSNPKLQLGGYATATVLWRAPPKSLKSQTLESYFALVSAD